MSEEKKPEDMEVLITSLRTDMLHLPVEITEEKEPTPEPEPEKVDPEPEKTEPEKAEPVKEPEPEKKVEEQPEDVGSLSSIPIKLPEPAPEPPKDDGLSEMDRFELKVLEKLGELDPKGHSGLVEKTKKFWEDKANYEAKFSKENPGQTIDWADEDHAAWLDKHEPTYDARLYNRATSRIEAEEIAAQAEKRAIGEANKVREELDAKAKWESEKSAINNAAVDSIVSLVTEVSPEFGKLLVVDGKADLSDKNMQALQKSDPLTFALIDDEVVKVATMRQEAEKLERLSGNYQLNPAVQVDVDGAAFYPHAEIVRIGSEMEDKLRSSPEKQVVNGRQWLPFEDALKQLSEAAKTVKTNDQLKAKVAEMEKKYWTVTPKMVANEYVKRATTRIKNRISSARPVAPSPQSDPDPEPEITPEPQQKAPETKKIVKAPSAASDADRPGGPLPSKGKSEITTEQFLSRSFPS